LYRSGLTDKEPSKAGDFATYISGLTDKEPSKAGDSVMYRNIKPSDRLDSLTGKFNCLNSSQKRLILNNIGAA
jgi:hypothetical protein